MGYLFQLAEDTRIFLITYSSQFSNDVKTGIETPVIEQWRHTCGHSLVQEYSKIKKNEAGMIVGIRANFFTRLN